MHVIICDSMRTHILNEQSSQYWNSCLVIFESNISSIFIWVIWLVRVIQMVCVPLVVTQKYLKCARVLKFATRNVVREFCFQDIQVQIRVFSGSVFMPRVTHEKCYSSFMPRATHEKCITSNNCQNIPHSLCKSLKIFSFTKYSLWWNYPQGHFLFHWIDFKYLYENKHYFNII
jgi:hypothetical protein